MSVDKSSALTLWYVSMWWLVYPCGFQSNAFLVMLLFWRLRIWPIHFHLRFLMVSVMGSWLVRSHNSMLVIFSGHLICRICRRHLLTKTCRSCSFSLVCFQVSEPYSRTDLTYVSNILSLFFLMMCLLLQIDLRVLKHVWLCQVSL